MPMAELHPPNRPSGGPYWRWLSSMARRYMRNERARNTLQTTALVNEVYLRLVDVKNVDWQHRAHFFAFSAHIMRNILVDTAVQKLVYVSRDMRFQPRHRLLPIGKHVRARILGIAKYFKHARQAESRRPGSNYCDEVPARPRRPRQTFN